MNSIDLAQLPAPQVVAPLDFETILADIKADFAERAPEYASVLDTPSEPLVKLMESAAYVALNLRQRVNDAAQGVLLATATGANLDNIAALFGVERDLVDAGDSEAVPPVPATYESDSRLRQRIQMSLEGFTTAGTIGAYQFHAFSASADVLDVAVASPAPGQVVMTLLATTGNGAADQALIDIVMAALEKVRPLTDQLSVQSATIVSYTVSAELTILSGPDSSVVIAAAETATAQYVAEQHRLGLGVTLSGLYAALHQAGVQNVTLTNPPQDIAVTPSEAAFCTTITIGVAA